MTSMTFTLPLNTPQDIALAAAIQTILEQARGPGKHDAPPLAAPRLREPPAPMPARAAEPAPEPEKVTPEQQAAPAPVPSLEDVQAAARVFIEKNDMTTFTALLKEQGVTKLSALPAESRAAFIERLQS